MQFLPFIFSAIALAKHGFSREGWAKSGEARGFPATKLLFLNANMPILVRDYPFLVAWPYAQQYVKVGRGPSFRGEQTVIDDADDCGFRGRLRGKS